jgi:type I restriction enzyme S subunit
VNTGFNGVPTNWTLTRLDRVASVNARIGWKALTADEYQDEGYAFLATPNIKSREIDFNNVNYISQHRYDESPELKLAVGDVLLTKDGNTLGITNVVRSLPRPATVNGSIAVLRPHAIDSRFLYYTIASTPTQERISAVKDGMGVPHLFQRDIKRLPVPLPPPEEQRRIADFLDAETRKIDRMLVLRKRQLNLIVSALEAKASQATGRTILHQKRTKSHAWMTPLRRAILTIQTGTTPDYLKGRNEIDPQEAIPWYTPATLDSMLSIKEAERFIAYSKKDTTPRFPAGSVIITGIGESLGKVGFLDHEATGNQQLTAITVNNKAHGRFLAWQLWAAEEEIRNWAQFSRVRIINNESLKSFPIYLPPLDLQVSVAQELDSLLENVNQLHMTISRFCQAMTEKRQTLITAAVTGQIDVSTAGGRGVL